MGQITKIRRQYPAFVKFKRPETYVFKEELISRQTADTVYLATQFLDRRSIMATNKLYHTLLQRIQEALFE